MPCSIFLRFVLVSNMASTTVDAWIHKVEKFS